MNQSTVKQSAVGIRSVSLYSSKYQGSDKDCWCINDEENSYSTFVFYLKHSNYQASKDVDIYEYEICKAVSCRPSN